MVTKAVPHPKDIHIHLHGLGKMAETDTGSEGEMFESGNRWEDGGNRHRQ